MSTPYRYSPQVPAGPNPTPLPGLAARPGSKLTRPPLQNPFDKFNQNEFDSWIGGITSALRKALGQEDGDIQKVPEPVTDKPSDGQSFGLKDVDMDAGHEGDESVLEDSFADFKARRSLKEKEWDPREGPEVAGANGWNADEPIELLSDDEDEEEQGNQDLLLGNEWEGGDDGEEDEGGSWDEDEGRSPSLDLESQPGLSQRLEVPQEQEVFELDDSEEEYEEEPLESFGHRRSHFLDEEAEVADDGDEEGDRAQDAYEEEYYEEEEPEGQQYEAMAGPHQVGNGHYEGYDKQDVPDDPEHEEEEEPRSSPPIQLTAEVDHDDEVIEARDDFPTEADLSPAESFQYPDDAGEVQPLADDTSFPPQQGEGPSHDEVTIRDPWLGPETYAEDFYSRGDRAIAHGSHLQPDTLEEEQECPGAGSCLAVADDEVFPPPSDSLAQILPLELPDVWEGPQNYAEDFYSGGDFKLRDGATFDVHQLESDRQGFLTPVISWDEQPGSVQATEDLQDDDNEQVAVDDVSPNPIEEASQVDLHEVDVQPSLSQLDSPDDEDEVMEASPPAQSQVVPEAIEAEELDYHGMPQTMPVEAIEEHEEEQMGDASPAVFEQMAAEETSLEVVSESGPSAATEVIAETSLITTEVLTIEDVEEDDANIGASREFNDIAEETPSQVQDAPVPAVLAVQMLEEASIEVEEGTSPSLQERFEEHGANPNEELAVEVASDGTMEFDKDGPVASAYSVTETRSEAEEGTSDDDADGEEIDDDVEILSVSSGVELMEHAEYLEEPDETEAGSVADSIVSVPNGSAPTNDHETSVDAIPSDTTAKGDVAQEDERDGTAGHDLLQQDRYPEDSAEDLIGEPSNFSIEDQETPLVHHDEALRLEDTTQALKAETSKAVADMEDANVVLDEPADEERVEGAVAEDTQPVPSPNTPDDVSIASTLPMVPEHQDQEPDKAGHVVAEPDDIIAEESTFPEAPAMTDTDERPGSPAANLTSPLLGTVIDETQVPPGVTLEPSNSQDADGAPLQDEKDQVPTGDAITIECNDKPPLGSQTPHDKESASLPLEDVSMGELVASPSQVEEVLVTEPTLPVAEQPSPTDQSMAPKLTLVPPTPNGQSGLNQGSTQPSLVVESNPASVSTPQFSEARRSAIQNYYAQYPPSQPSVEATQTAPSRSESLPAPAYPFQASIYPAPFSEQVPAPEASIDETKTNSALLLEAVAESDLFKLMGSDKHFFPGEAHNDGPDVGEASASSGGVTPQVDQGMKGPIVEATNTSPSRQDDVFDSPSNHLAQESGSRSTNVVQLEPKMLAVPPSASPAKAASSSAKRKRQNMGPGRPRKKGKDKQLDGDQSVGVDKSIRVKPRPIAKGKAKRSASPAVKSKAPPSSASGASGSSASSAARMLLQPSNNRSSRASSVVSSAASDVRSQASPTFTKPTVTLLTQPPMNQPPLFHAHGAKRKQLQHLSFASAQNVLQGRSPSFTRLGDATSPVSPTAPHMQLEGSQPGTSGAPPRRNHTWTSSPVPVTRSHCRFHKISIPRDDDGPRIFFIVPGCSLTKEEVMEEEEVVDHGDATYEDSQRMVTDVETLGFEDFLINSLRLLVGAEIFREREIFYLPLPGEEVRRREESGPKQSLVATGPSLLGASKTDVNLVNQIFSSTDSEASSEEEGSDYEEVKLPVAKKARGMRAEKSETNKGTGDAAQAAPGHAHNPKASRPGPQKRPRQEGHETDDVRPSKKVRPQTTHAVSNPSTVVAETTSSPLSPASDMTHPSVR